MTTGGGGSAVAAEDGSAGTAGGFAGAAGGSGAGGGAVGTAATTAADGIGAATGDATVFDAEPPRRSAKTIAIPATSATATMAPTIMPRDVVDGATELAGMLVSGRMKSGLVVADGNGPVAPELPGNGGAETAAVVEIGGN